MASLYSRSNRMQSASVKISVRSVLGGRVIRANRFDLSACFVSGEKYRVVIIEIRIDFRGVLEYLN